jgi:hypothetical protein
LFATSGQAGVSGSLELLINYRYTNLRAQIQLKGTITDRVNQDISWKMFHP